MSNVFSKNLRYLRNKKDMDQDELAKLLGRKSSSSISEWEKGTYTPKSGVLSDIAKIFNVNLEDLMNEDLTKEISNIKNITKITPIPILGKVACGDPIDAEENIKGYTYELPDTLPVGEFICLETVGDSMHPTIPEGSNVIIRKQPDVESGEIAAVLLNGDLEATLKRVKKQKNNIVLIPDNSDHDPIIVNEEYPAKIIGKAVKFTQNL
ncbi:LexA family protein [Alkalibacillus almallahensis]|uniref:LexA family protein n=1 Tax=Alkalibacillus almallahensis TaxID=1379154 RepID=UPI0014220C19|nr:XRE family transcriptional regulator [Alkalibacillus almallahensis]NIK10873.1 repressor LexA [Alkalibacillus almallahensis]